MIEIADVTAFLATHARLLDRRRAEIALGTGNLEATLAALAAHRNPDGGFGWALEPDLRVPSSQPGGALHAFEVLDEIAPATSPLATDLCDWLAGASLPGGALPFALAGSDQPGSAPFWREADPTAPSLHITSAVAGMAHRVARHDRAVAGHPWLRAATRLCLDEIAAIDAVPHAVAFRFILQFLDAAHDAEPRAAAELQRLARFLPASGTLAVTGGAPDEAIRPLDFSPEPDRPLRALFDPAVIETELDRLEAEQAADGGWHVDFVSYSPAGTLEWRGYATVRALQILIAHGRIRPG